jgi:hypothetical protein
MGRMAKQKLRIIILLFFFPIIGFGQDKISKNNNWLVIGEYKISQTFQNEIIRYSHFESNWMILFNSLQFNRKHNCILFNDAFEIIPFDVSYHDKIFYWQNKIVYRKNSKTGKWFIYTIYDKSQLMLSFWIENLYIVEDELCIKTNREFMSIISSRKYPLSFANEELLPISFLIFEEQS